MAGFFATTTNRNQFSHTCRQGVTETNGFKEMSILKTAASSFTAVEKYMLSFDFFYFIIFLQIGEF